jgi:hypothetical protein
MTAFWDTAPCSRPRFLDVCTASIIREMTEDISALTMEAVRISETEVNVT